MPATEQDIVRGLTLAMKIAYWLEPHHVEWVLQQELDGHHLYVLEVGTVQTEDGAIQTRSVWQDATDWNKAQLKVWLGY